MFCFETNYLNVTGHIACLPPSTGSETPVIKDAAELARKIIAAATSSGFPFLPMA